MQIGVLGWHVGLNERPKDGMARDSMNAGQKQRYICKVHGLDGPRAEEHGCKTENT